MKRIVWSAICALLMLGCDAESSTDETTETDTSSLSGQFGNTEDSTILLDEPSIPDPVDFGIVIEEKNTDLTEDAYRVFFNQFIPEGCSNESPCPLLVLVADKDASGDAFFGEETPRWIAAKSGAIVATYNSPGRGEGARKSTGEEDFNGTVGQDALSDVLNYMIKSPRTNDQVGIISFGYGLVAASGALSRFKSNKLKEVDFLLDVEGPVNRCWATAVPGNAEEGIEADGPGVNEGRCDFDLGPRQEAFPFTLPNNAPAPIICNENAFPLKQSGVTCEDDQWWYEREAKIFLDDIAGNYMRIQMLNDHRQASRWSSLQAIKYVVKSDVDNHVLNNQSPNQPLFTVGDTNCVEQGCYLDFTAEGLGNSLAFPACFDGQCIATENPYSAAFDGFKAFPLEDFAQYVLPVFIEQLWTL